MDGAAIDSRLVEPGDSFFALPGERVDGHAFLEEAAARGASELVIHESYQGESFGVPTTRVADVLWELQERARLLLEKQPKRVVAISGSLGKTTTKGFTHTLLAQKYKVWASPKSYNSQATVPLSILMCPQDVEILILEMGMSKPGQIRRLVEIAPPEVALLTLVALQHADDFTDGLEGIRREKLSLFSHPQTRLCIRHESIEGAGVPFTVEDRYQLNWPKPWLHNFCAAEAIARAFGVEEIEAAIPKLELPPMRLQEVRKKEILFINDAYNANPDSMVVALQELGKKRGRRIAVLSEMNALGSYARMEHEAVAKEALKNADLLLCLGEHCVTMQEVWERAGQPVFFCKTKAELQEKVKQLLIPGDCVLLKGARSHALEEILDDF